MTSTTTHFFHPNNLQRYSLGTKKNLRKSADGSLTLYVGAKSPGADKESNWLPAPNGPFSLYVRAYWGQPRHSRRSWKSPVIRKVTARSRRLRLQREGFLLRKCAFPDQGMPDTV